MDALKVIKSIYDLPKGTILKRFGHTNFFQDPSNIYSTGISESHANDLIDQGILIRLAETKPNAVNTASSTNKINYTKGDVIEISKENFDELRKAWGCLKLVNAELVEELNYYEQKLGRLNEANTESEFKNNQKAALTSLISCLDRYLKTIKNY